MWKKRIVQVDVSCPNDLMVPFLMDRGEDKQTKQDLLDKKGVWYTGVELRHAVLTLGYRVTKIYQYYQWTMVKDIFTDFVTTEYADKQAAPKDTPIYTTKKNTLNGCTGKFAQVSKSFRTRIFLPEDTIPKMEIEQMTAIRDDTNGECLGWFVKESQKNEYSKFPIQLSVFILAYSKIIMSNMMHSLGLQKEEKDGVMYGDTDSLIFHQQFWPTEKAHLDNLWIQIEGQMIPWRPHPPFIRASERFIYKEGRYVKIWEGTELSQAKQEVDGKIIGIVVLGPKNYVVIFICNKTLKIMAKARCKSIPHTLKDYDAGEEWHVSEKEKQKALDIYHSIQDKSTLEFVLGTDIKARYYIFEQVETGELFVTSKIPALWFTEILHGTKIMNVLYGTMFRRFCPTNPGNILIAPDMKHRNMGKNSFWKRQDPKRIIKNGPQWGTAYPPGHYRLME